MASSSGCALGEGVTSLPGAAGRGASACRSDQRFPRSCRLTSRRQYRAVYDRGVRVSCASFAVFALPNDAGTTRLGVTATRKFGGAVRRNRAKRLIRELFRRNRAALPACALDLVVNAHGAMLGRSYGELEPEWLRLLGQLDRRLGR